MMSPNSSKVTDNTHEMTFQELFSQPAQITIPLFQRAYVWTNKQLERLTQEIDAIVDGTDSSRFLGAIIAVKRDANPATPQPYEIVDGQQRLTTLYMFMLAASYVAAKKGDEDYAFGLINSNLIVDWWKSGPNTKLIPSFADGAQFAKMYESLLKLGALSDMLAGRVILPNSQGTETGKLIAQYRRIQKLLMKRVEIQGLDHLKELVLTAQAKLSFVFILLKDASNATTVFEGLNDPGIPIGIGDLVRNEVFSKVSDKPAEAIAVHQQVWVPFRDSLGEHFDNYFFPFGIVKNSSISRADLFKGLQEIWQHSNDPKVIVSVLEKYKPAYLSVVDENYSSPYAQEIQKRLRSLRSARIPTATFPFVLRLLHEYENENVAEKDTSEVLAALESFLVRRAIVGIEPSGLLVFFRTAWSVMADDISKDSFAAALKKRATIEWPEDDRVLQALKTRKIYKSGIKDHILAEYDKELGGDVPTNIPWVEHVLPQKFNDHWNGEKNDNAFSKNEHEDLLHTIGNLIPLSAKMNIVVSDGPYDKKRSEFSNNSMYKSARNLAENFDCWGPSEILARSEIIAKWAVQHWER